MALRRAVVFIITLTGVTVIAFIMCLLVVYFLFLQEPSLQDNSTLVLRVSGGLIERQPLSGLNQFLGSKQTVQSVIDSLRKAKVDSRISGVILVPSGPQDLWGKVQEIRDAVHDFRKSGKPIVAFLEYGGQQEYYLATACDQVYMMPESHLDLTGVASYAIFLKDFFSAIGVYPDMLRAGDYKTAANLFTEATFTPAHREMLAALNFDMYGQLIQGIAAGRKMSEVRVRELIEGGPLLSEGAVNAGLVDGLLYEDEIRDVDLLAQNDSELIDDSYYRQFTLSSLGLNQGRKIAVVYADGVIAIGESGFDTTGNQVVGSRTLIQSIRIARDDDSVLAIVLRVNSPGGSASASDAIWREVMLAREIKPVIASMSDLGASGGYYIAVPANAIVAQPATLTGSIGVITGKFSFGEMSEKVGVNIESVSDGRYAEIYSPARPFSDDERIKVEEQMTAIYDSFVKKVANARDTTPERIDEVARGRVWTGQQAKEVDLIDELGGLNRALELAKEHANIPLDEEVELIVYPQQRSLFDLILGAFSMTAQATQKPFLMTPEVRALRLLVSPLQLFRRGEPLVLMPYALLH